MKNKKSLQKSAKACLKRAISTSGAIHTLLQQQKDGFCETRQATIRGHVWALTKDVHEYNAYNNALITE